MTGSRSAHSGTFERTLKEHGMKRATLIRVASVVLAFFALAAARVEAEVVEVSDLQGLARTPPRAATPCG